MPYTAAQLAAYYTAVNFGQAPDATLQTVFAQAATANAAGSAFDQQTINLALRNPQLFATTDVAVAVYQYFNGSAPSQAGLNFLINTPGSGLNTTYYNGATGTAAVPSAGGFNLENRYYNLAVSQAFQGPNAAAFAATYGALTLQQTVATAYEQIVGAAVVGTPQANAAIAAIQASIPFFQQVAAERAKEFNQDLAAKAVIVGYILEESIKADVGAYALAINQHNAAIAAGNAVYNANILTTYAPGAASYGIGVGGGLLPTNLGGSTIPQQRLNLGDGAVVNVLGSLTNGLTLQLRDASGPSNSLNLTFANGSPTLPGNAVVGLTLGGTATPGTIETLTITSNGNLTSSTFGSDHSLVLMGGTAPNTVVVRGAQPFALFTGAVTHAMLVDGSGMSASLVVRADATTAAGVGVNINGGSANDSLIPGLSSTAAAQTIYGGRGGDLILLGGGTFSYDTYSSNGSATHKPIDTIVYKAASDSLFDPEGDPGATRTASQFANTGKMDLIVGFVTGQDKIDVKAVGFTQAQLTLADKGNVADLAAFNALVASGNLFKDGGGVVRGVSAVHNEGNILLFFDVNHNGAFEATGDLVVQLLGIPTVAAGDFVGT